MKKKHANILFLGLIILFYFVIASTGILSADDFRWGSSDGVNRLATNFDNYNGRYLGNYIIFLITRSHLANILFQVIVNTGIIVLVHRILERKISFPMITFFFLTMPISLYRDTYAWMSGFANYNTSIFFVLLIIYLLGNDKINYKELFILFISGFSVQLFLENVSAVNIILTFVFLVFALFNRQYIKKATILFSSNLLGTITMFSNTAYIDTDSLRSLSSIDFNIIPRSFLTVWGDLFFKDNIILLFFLAIGLYLILNNNKYLKYIIFPIPIYFLLRYQFGLSWSNLPTKLLYMEAFFLILFIFIVFYFVYLSDVLTKKTKINFYFFFLLAGLYSGPLLVIAKRGVQPYVTSRNVLTTYILLIIAILHLYIPFLKYESQFVIYLNKYIKLIVVSIMLVVGSMSLVNSIYDNSRLISMQEAVQNGETSIEVEQLPFRKLVRKWGFHESDMYMPEFKEYYNIPEDIQINEVPFENNSFKD